MRLRHSFAPTKSAAGLICNKPMDRLQHHCYGCQLGGGADRRHAVVARCFADVIQSHSDIKVFIEQDVLALTRVVNEQSKHARMDLVFNLNGSFPYLDLSIVDPWSCNPLASLSSQHQSRKTFMTNTHTSTSVVFETTSRLGPHARKCISHLMPDGDNPFVFKDTWSVQSVFYSASTQHLRGSCFSVG